MKPAALVTSWLSMVVLGALPVAALAQTREVANTSGALPSVLGDPSDYRLVAGDKLRIEVYKDPMLSQSLQIRPDGKITLPLIGDVLAAGATPIELTAVITQRLREYVTAPSVTVIVSESVAPTIYVMGEVNSPGAKPMPTPITVVQALAVAGGFKDFANPKKIRILRRGANGAVETINFNYKDALAHPERPMLLKPGDTVIVP